MRRSQIHIIIIATVFGILAWVSVTLREEYDVTVAVPFLLENIPPGIAIKSPLPGTVQLKFHGDGWRLAGLLLTREPKLVFSANALPRGNHPLVFNDIAEHVSLTPGIRLLDVKPDSIQVEFDRAIRKKVPVVLDCIASFREGYGQVGPTSVLPDSITLMGAESVLRTIETWKTEHRVFDNVKTSLDVDVPLAAPTPYSIDFSVPEVRISIAVEPFAEKAFRGIPVDVTGVPQNREVILIPPRVDIVVRAGIKQLSSLTQTDFHVSSDYEKIAADSTGEIDMDITCPAGVQLVTRHPEHLQYIIRKRL